MTRATEPSITQYPPAMADGGFPDGRWVQGAAGTQAQSPKSVPASSRSVVAMAPKVTPASQPMISSGGGGRARPLRWFALGGLEPARQVQRLRRAAKSGLPASWTDVVPADPIVVAAKGRAHFRAEDLWALAQLVRRLSAAQAGRVKGIASSV